MGQVIRSSFGRPAATIHLREDRIYLSGSQVRRRNEGDLAASIAGGNWTSHI
jgi:hypothetical protein